ncbi:MAG: immunity 53 family protein [Cyanobacteria bacterium P01_D01_bin.1]
MKTALDDIQDWYSAQCDEDWEHSFGITIETLDNPGWAVKIDLEGTLLEAKEFHKIAKEETEDSWLVCKVEGKKFVGYGDPSRLEEVLLLFLQWAKSE